MATPKISSLLYPVEKLDQWVKGDCRMLSSSGASDFLKKILVEKVQRRGGGRRFFGEAYVATQIRHRAGYYGSFKWLTNARFSGQRRFPDGPTREFQEALRDALVEHFGRSALEKLHARAATLQRRTGVRAVAPDLWLIDGRGNHRFIEVKLQGDRIRATQLAGMALISSCLEANRRVSVEIVELRPDLSVNRVTR